MINIGFLIDSRDYYNDFIKFILKKEDVTCSFLFKDNNYFNFDNLKIYNSLDEIIENNDLIFSLGYWKIISKKQLEKIKIINLHYSYLLKYEGRHTCTWAIQNNEKYHGVTLHYMTDILDNGPIIDSKKIIIDKYDTSYSLMNKCNKLSLEMFKDNFDIIASDSVNIILQKDNDPQLYSYKDINHEIPNNFLKDEIIFYNLVRSLTYPNKPLPYLKINNKKIKLLLE